MARMVVQWATLLGLAFVLTSCTWFRKDTEKMFYRRGVWILETTLSSETKQKCAFNFDLDYPYFWPDDKENLDGYRANYNPKTVTLPDGTEVKGIIRYDRYSPSVIVHEAIHHIEMQSHWESSDLPEKWCMWQALAEAVYRIHALQNRNQALQMAVDAADIRPRR